MLKKQSNLDTCTPIEPKEWSSIISGLRKNLNLSQTKLSKILGFSRQAISKFESKQRTPTTKSMNNISAFIEKNKFDIDQLIELGNKHSSEYLGREKVVALKLEESKDLAELIGIILGDGEIRKCGEIRISFDPKKDEDYLNRRICPLITSLLQNKPHFESNKRIAFGNIAFARYLNSIGLASGSKFEHGWEIPQWCFSKKDYTAAVIRGLFDTDGYFGYLNGSLELMLGRFSHRSYSLVTSISSALNLFGITHKIKQNKDRRYKIRITSRVSVFKFFNSAGSSDLGHIIAFLLWRLNKYEAKIELEGLESMINKINKLINFDINSINLPFLWGSDNDYFRDYIEKDLQEVKGAKIRNLFKWPELIKSLIKLVGNKQLAHCFGITERSVRKWREGNRVPSNKFIIQIIRLAEEHNVNLEEYMGKKQTVDALIEGGKASAAPPLGPAL